MNGKGSHILFRVLWYFHDAFLPSIGYALIASPSDSDLHASMPLAGYGDAAYELPAAPIRFDAVPAVTIDREHRYPGIRVI